MTDENVSPGERTGKTKEKGPDLETLPVLVSPTVTGIAQDGASDGLEMAPDLVKAAGPKGDLKFRNVPGAVEGNDLELRPGRLSVQWPFDNPLFSHGSRVSQDFHAVALLQRFFPEEA